MKIGFFIINNVIRGGGLVATESAIKLLCEKHEIIVFLQEVREEGTFLSEERKYPEEGAVRFVPVGNINNPDLLLKKNSRREFRHFYHSLSLLSTYFTPSAYH